MKDDTISRKVALKGLEDLNIASFYELNEHSKEAYTEVKAMLKALPPAQPEYERVSAEDVAVSIAPTKLASAVWLYGTLTELEKAGYVICRRMT